MIGSLEALLIIFAAVIGSTALVGILGYFLHRIRQIEGRSPDGAGSRQLADQVDLMREELQAVQQEMSALTERLDFTEKLLTSGDDAAPSTRSE